MARLASLARRVRLAPALTCAPHVSTRARTFSKQGPRARPDYAITQALRPTHSCPRAGVGDHWRGTPPPGALVSPARNAPPPSSLAALSRPSLAAMSALAPHPCPRALQRQLPATSSAARSQHHPTGTPCIRSRLARVVGRHPLAPDASAAPPPPAPGHRIPARRYAARHEHLPP